MFGSGKNLSNHPSPAHMQVMGQSWGPEAFLSCAKTAEKVIFKSLVLEQRLHCVMREVLLSYHK